MFMFVVCTQNYRNIAKAGQKIIDYYRKLKFGSKLCLSDEWNWPIGWGSDLTYPIVALKKTKSSNVCLIVRFDNLLHDSVRHTDLIAIVDAPHSPDQYANSMSKVIKTSNQIIDRKLFSK